MALVIFDEAATDRVLTSRDGPVARDLLRRGRSVHSEAARLCPVDTGRLRSSIRVELAHDERGLLVLVGTDVNYSRYVHDGTGVYGPSGTPIRPLHGMFLVFTPKGASAPVFAREVRGMPGRPFLVQALNAARNN